MKKQAGLGEEHPANSGARDRAGRVRNLCVFWYTVLVLIAIGVCALCDRVVCGGITWSAYAISGTVFGWLITFPLAKSGKRGGVRSLWALSLFLLPFLLTLDSLLKPRPSILPVGIPMAALSLGLLWGICLIFRIWGGRKWLAAAASFLLALLAALAINLSLSGVIGGAAFEVWDLFAYIPLAGGVVLCTCFALRERGRT